MLKLPRSEFTSAETFLLGVIQSCIIEKHDNDLDYHYYTWMGVTEVVNIRTIQCAVGRIFDCSGELLCAMYIEEPEELDEYNAALLLAALSCLIGWTQATCAFTWAHVPWSLNTIMFMKP